jgi:hypothetical protein
MPLNQRWEHRVVEVSNADARELERELEREAADGWELVSTTVFYNYWWTKIVTRMFLKRERAR